MENEYYAQIGNRFVNGQPFGIGESARRQHIYAVGKTGVGKSTLLRNLIEQDILAGKGVGLIDPHGDLACEVLDLIPSWRSEDVFYFNPGDHEFPVGFNLLQNVPRESRHLIASGIVGAFKSIWGDSWGPRMEYILYAGIAALLDNKGQTLLGLQRMLVDAEFRREIVQGVENPAVRSFWLDEFENYDARFRREAIAPIQNKIGQILMAAPIRNVLGQVARKFDPRFTAPPLTPTDGRLGTAGLKRNFLAINLPVFKVVGPAGFEPTASSPPVKRATRLRYGPKRR
jgi:hypothetical protein